MPVKNRIQLRRGTSTQWGNSADILASGEMGWDSTENNIKIGNGTNYWVDLPWLADPGHINDLHDVNTSGLADNNLLVWNSGADYWEPTTSLTFDGTTLHTDTDGISAIFGRSNAQTVGGKVRIYVDDGDTASSVQAIKAFNAKTTGTNYGINATANGLGATKNVGLYGWAAQATTNWGLWVDSGYCILDDKVGIKTSSPAYDLHVNGSGYIVNNFDVGGDTTITGNLAASTKSFLIDHPTKKDKKLQYGSLESPYHGVRLTGRDSLKDGICVVKLPSYMKKLVKEDEINIQITNYKHAKTLYVDDIDLKKNCFIIKGHRCKTLGPLEFFWSFTAIRKDVPDLIVEK